LDLGRAPLLGGFTACFPGSSDDKQSACNAGDPGLIPGWRRSPGEGNGNPLQYSYLENFMDRGAWWAVACPEPWGCKRVRHDLVTKQLNSIVYTLLLNNI